MAQHPEGNIFQTPEMYDLLSAAKNNQPLFIAVTDTDDHVKGLVMAVIQTQYPGLLKKLTARSVVWGTPVVKDNNKEILALILENYDRLIKHKAIYSQFRSLWQQQEEKEIFAAYNFEFEEHLDILVDLSLSEEELNRQMHKERRHNIRRAVKKGVTFQELIHPEGIDAAHALVKNTYKRIKLPVPDKTFFHHVYRLLSPKGMVKFFAARFNGIFIGVRIVLCYKDIIYDWWTGSLDEYKNKYPNDLLPWKIFLWGKENGYKRFDFGGAGKPGQPYSVRDYKLKFGGQLVNYGRYEKVHKPLLMKTAKMGFKLWQHLR